MFDDDDQETHARPVRAIHFGRRELLIGASSLVLSTFAFPLQAAEPLVVIVHPTNDEDISPSELAAIFTTRKRSWRGGERILPFNFPPKHSLRVEFDESILSMNSDAVARYWIDRRVRGGNSPPKQISNAQLIVRLVGKLDGAVAYVPRSAAQGSVRIVSEI